MCSSDLAEKGGRRITKINSPWKYLPKILTGGRRIGGCLVGKDAANGRQELHEPADMASGRREVDERPVPAHDCRHGTRVRPPASGCAALGPSCVGGGAAPPHELGSMVVRRRPWWSAAGPFPNGPNDDWVTASALLFSSAGN